ncbi:MAG: hypothetical protein GTN53_30655 [Candidatus Aminicenantes bacterium]|nr:hypothetical protein [Candidatus Aminicenantes bacterium]
MPPPDKKGTDNKRFLDRLPIKLFIKYGREQATYVGFSTDISNNGIFLKSNKSFEPETTLKLQITLPDGKIIDLKGTVVWAKKLASKEGQLEVNGMGIRIVHSNPMYTKFIHENQKKIEKKG